MSRTVPWQDGRRAWNRLNGLYRWTPTTSPTSSEWVQSDRAGRALADIRLVRGLLDQAEVNAVKTARLGGMTWAEIAAHLGVTRQAAWERWHELVPDDANSDT